MERWWKLRWIEEEVEDGGGMDGGGKEERKWEEEMMVPGGRVGRRGVAVAVEVADNGFLGGEDGGRESELMSVGGRDCKRERVDERGEINGRGGDGRSAPCRRHV